MENLKIKIMCGKHRLPLEGEPVFYYHPDPGEYQIDTSEMACPGLPIEAEEPCSNRWVILSCDHKQYDDTYNNCATITCWNYLQSAAERRLYDGQRARKHDGTTGNARTADTNQQQGRQ